MSLTSLARLYPPFKKGQPVWLIVNGEPSLWHYLRPNGHGHVLTLPGEDHGHYHDTPLFHATEVGAIMWLLEGAESRVEDALRDLTKRREQLAHVLRSASS